MKYRFLVFLITLSIIPVISWAQFSGKVTSVTSGDTFVMFMVNKQQVRVKLSGIDSPERDQAFGRKAKDFLTRLINNKNVKVKKVTVDNLGRTIAIVTVGGKVVNEELLKAGLAWHIPEDETPGWTELEEEARNKKAGLWSVANPIAPWEWRKSH